MTLDLTLELGLEALYRATESRFDLESPGTVTHHFGWLESTQQHVGNRVIWKPGDPSEAAGVIAAPRYPGGNPRALGNMTEIFTCTIQGYDPTAPTSELANWRACRLLFDAWWRAIYLASYEVGLGGVLKLTSAKWLKTAPKQRSAGVAIVATCAIMVKIPDEIFAGAPVGTTAHVDYSMLDQAEDATYTADPIT